MVDLSGALQSELEKAEKKAKEFVESNEFSSAADEYERCSRIMEQLSRYAFSKEGKANRLLRSAEYKKMAGSLRSGKPIKKIAKGEVISAESGGEPEEDFSGRILGFIEKSPISWNEIGGLEDTKRTIKESIVLALAKKPEKVEIEGWNRILLFGPPGTGKTLLASATSNDLGALFFNVKFGQIMSKWFGESPKILETLFRVARDKSPSVVFFDDFDSLASSRSDSQSEGRRALLSTFLIEMDGLSTKKSKSFVLTLASTNTPWDIDEAMLSRFQKRIYIPLPDEKAREQIFKIHLEKRGFVVNNYSWIIGKTEGYSGRDIQTLCMAVVNNMIREMNPKIHEFGNLDDVKNYEIKIRELRRDDFEIGLKRVKPITTKEMAMKHEEWREKFEAT